MNDAIARIQNPTQPEFQATILAARKPVIIVGGMHNWLALSRWTLSYLKTKVGCQRVEIHVSETGTFIGTPKEGFAPLKQKMLMSEYLDLLATSTPGKTGNDRRYYYLQQQPIVEVFPQLVEEINIPRYFEAREPEFTGLWIGARDNISPLHYDVMDNLLAQVSGRKKIILFAPEQTDLLYPFSVRSQIAHLSQIDNLNQPDLKRFPKLQRAQPRECILEAGEILFIPVFWWHQVHSLERVNISVNFWWSVPWMKFLCRPGLRMAARSAWQTLRGRDRAES